MKSPLGPPTVSYGLELGKRIKALRQALGLTQQDLADKVNLSRAAVAYWEAGKSGHAGKHLKAIAEALGVQPEALTTGLIEEEAYEIKLSAEEYSLVTLYRSLTAEQRLSVQRVIERNSLKRFGIAAR
jgi:transcriptional regulator with XRE-family HTH domain